MTDRAGQVITFYSYKGGVGRTMSLANVAIDLARFGLRVLAIDWDLEAPGLHKYLRWTEETHTDGVLELVTGGTSDWRGACRRVAVPSDREVRGLLDLIPAGRLDRTYAARLQGLDWRRLYESGLGQQLETWRDEWTREYDVVLIDSRTGMSDAGGICTIQLPDVLIGLFTANEQSVQGVEHVAQVAIDAQAKMPIDRGRLLFVPVPTRVDLSEYRAWRDWQATIEQTFAPFVKQWALHEQASPADAAATVRHLLGHLAIPYVPYFSFGERLPTVEERSKDKLQIGYALESLAALIARRFDAAFELARERDRYVRRAMYGLAEADAATQGSRVFISHAVADAELARMIARRLQQRGFLATRSGDVQGASMEAEAERLEGDVVQAGVLIYVVGTETGAWQRDELSAFMRSSLEGVGERSILPVVRWRSPPQALPGLLKQLPKIDEADHLLYHGHPGDVVDEDAVADRVVAAVESVGKAVATPSV